MQPGVRPIVDANARLHYDSEIGALADALHRGGFATAVVANADGREPDAGRVPDDATPGPSRQRQAVLGLMDGHGTVDEGLVDDSLLEVDASAPFGVRLDHDAVLGAFDDVWSDRHVVLVEASDLARADRYRPYVSDAEQTRQRRAALRRTDELFGRLLERVRPAPTR